MVTIQEIQSLEQRKQNEQERYNNIKRQLDVYKQTGVSKENKSNFYELQERLIQSEREIQIIETGISKLNRGFAYENVTQEMDIKSSQFVRNKQQAQAFKAKYGITQQQAMFQKQQFKLANVENVKRFKELATDYKPTDEQISKAEYLGAVKASQDLYKETGKPSIYLTGKEMGENNNILYTLNQDTYNINPNKKFISFIKTDKKTGIGYALSPSGKIPIYSTATNIIGESLLFPSEKIVKYFGVSNVLKGIDVKYGLDKFQISRSQVKEFVGETVLISSFSPFMKTSGVIMKELYPAESFARVTGVQQSIKNNKLFTDVKYKYVKGNLKGEFGSAQSVTQIIKTDSGYKLGKTVTASSSNRLSLELGTGSLKVTPKSNFIGVELSKSSKRQLQVLLNKELKAYKTISLTESSGIGSVGKLSGASKVSGLDKVQIVFKNEPSVFYSKALSLTKGKTTFIVGKTQLALNPNYITKYGATIKSISKSPNVLIKIPASTKAGFLKSTGRIGDIFPEINKLTSVPKVNPVINTNIISSNVLNSLKTSTQSSSVISSSVLTKTLNVAVTQPKPVTTLKIIPSTKLFSSTKTRQADYTKQVNIQRTIQTPKEKIEEITLVTPKIAQTPVQRIEQITITTPIQTLKTPTKPIIRIPTFTLIPPTSPPPIVPKIIIPTSSYRKRKKSSPSYTVSVRRFGKWKPYATSSSVSKAFNIGKGYTSGSLGASFKISGIGKMPTSPLGYYRKQEKGESIFIEKRKYRLSTPTEKKEINLFKSLKQPKLKLKSIKLKGGKK